MLVRVLEPEVMDTVDEAVDYNQMDHSHVNRAFVDDFLSARNDATQRDSDCFHVFDAGTGTALIPIEMMRRGIAAVVTASDLAESMLAVARENIREAGFETAIFPVLRDCKQMPEPDSTYDAVMSNSIVHHIPEPRMLFQELWRVLKPGGLFFVRDLMRPDDRDTLETLVIIYAGDANDHQRQMFRDSLHAALTVVEVRDLVREFGISSDAVQATSDRHWTIRWKKASPPVDAMP
jgi:ubiquinone/menaquinone biosynthesis C-methylase UbiE